MAEQQVKKNYTERILDEHFLEIKNSLSAGQRDLTIVFLKALEIDEKRKNFGIKLDKIIEFLK